MCLDERIGRCVCVTYFSSKIDQVATPTVDEISDASFKKKKEGLFSIFKSRWCRYTCVLFFMRAMWKQC